MIIDGTDEIDVDLRSEGGRLWATPAQLEAALGWQLKPEGLCRGDVCLSTKAHPDLVGDRDDIDEGWAFTIEEGKALLAAAAPAKLTRPGAITVVWSAGGTPASTWLAQLMARGRAGDPTIGYVEFGVPDDLDMDDLQTVAEYHPSYRCAENPHGLVTVESIRGSWVAVLNETAHVVAPPRLWPTTPMASGSTSPWSSLSGSSLAASTSSITKETSPGWFTTSPTFATAPGTSRLVSGNAGDATTKPSAAHAGVVSAYSSG